jgi:excisionase family DNA binding protein
VTVSTSGYGHWLACLVASPQGRPRSRFLNAPRIPIDPIFLSMPKETLSMNKPKKNECLNHRYWTVREIADRWQSSERHVYRAIKNGQLTAHKFGHLLRVSDPDLNNYERVNRAD